MLQMSCSVITQDNRQNNTLMLEIMLYCKTWLLYCRIIMKPTSLNNSLTIILRYINLFSMDSVEKSEHLLVLLIICL